MAAAHADAMPDAAIFRRLSASPDTSADARALIANARRSILDETPPPVSVSPCRCTSWLNAQRTISTSSGIGTPFAQEFFCFVNFSPGEATASTNAQKRYYR
jgi:hypothetical protein